MTGESNKFTIKHGDGGSTTFELEQLPALKSLELSEEVFAMLPALTALKGLQEQAKAGDADPKATMAANAASIVAMSRMVKHVVKFAPHFQEVCKASRAGLANGLVPLRSQVTFDSFFGRNQSLLIQWVLQCVELEFKSFLVEESSRNQATPEKQPPST
jgi:hypothetical protein